MRWEQVDIGNIDLRLAHDGDGLPLAPIEAEESAEIVDTGDIVRRQIMGPVRTGVLWATACGGSGYKSSNPGSQRLKKNEPEW